jgi:hypothetical protein
MPGDRSGWNAIMQYSFLKVFANDGVIDTAELAMIERLALEDGRIDQKEREVLSAVFARVDPATLATDVRDEIARFKTQHDIP